MNTRLLIPFFCVSLSSLSCTKKNDDTHETHSDANNVSARPAPEGGSGSTRDALPADGAAETGMGVTSSNTSAASGAVQMPGDPGQSSGPTANQADQGTTGTPNNEGSQGSPTRQD